MAEVLKCADFRRLSDWYGFKDVSARLPKLETCFLEARSRRRELKVEMEWYERRKQTVPQHLEDAYNEASWAWQRAYGAFKLARRLYKSLLEQYPEWSEENGRENSKSNR